MKGSMRIARSAIMIGTSPLGFKTIPTGGTLLVLRRAWFSNHLDDESWYILYRGERYHIYLDALENLSEEVE